MPRRISIVDEISIKNVVSSSNLQIGDSVNLNPISRALAVKKEFPIFSEGEWDFANFDFFSQPLPSVEDHCTVNMEITNEVPVIKVGRIDILGIAASSILHVGSTHNIDAKSRVKHFRQYLYPLSEELVAYLSGEEEDEE